MLFQASSVWIPTFIVFYFHMSFLGVGWRASNAKITGSAYPTIDDDLMMQLK